MSLRGKAVEVIVEDELEPTTTAAVDDALDDGVTIAMALVFATGVGALMGVLVGLDPVAVVIYTYFAVAIAVALLAAGIRHSLTASEAQLDVDSRGIQKKRLVPIAVAERRAEASRVARLAADEEAWRAREAKRDQRLLDRELERHALAEREFAGGVERKRAYHSPAAARPRPAYVLPRAAVSSQHAGAHNRVGVANASARDRGWFDNPITGVHDNLVLTNGTGRPMTGRVIVPSVLCANKSFSLAAGATETIHSNCTPREIQIETPAVGVISFPAVATHRDRPAKLTVILTPDGRIADVAPSGYYHT